MIVYYSDTYMVPLPPGHKFPMEKYGLLRTELLEQKILLPDELYEAPLATREQLITTHTQEYVDAFFEGTLDPKIIRRIGLPWSEAFVHRTRATCGGTISAILTAYYQGFAGNLAGGTHHAFADKGEGFCVFNDIAVGLNLLFQEKRIRKAAVIDLDVHQGNGTASIFRENPAVYTLSMHGEKNYPFTKIPSTRDVDLPDDCTDEEYLTILSHELLAVQAFDPDFLVYQAGVDVLAEDALGRLALSYQGVYERDCMVFRFAQALGIPLAMTLGGGYAKPLTPTIMAYAGSYRAAKKFFA